MVRLGMHEIPISKFKATCLSVMDEVRRTRSPIRVTRFGRPVAEIVPPSDAPRASWLGCMRGAMEVEGDIVEPIGAFDHWKTPKR
jgi:prevent-host-death family protein